VTPEQVPVAGLAAFLGWLVLQRSSELYRSRRNARAVRKLGGVERSGGHFPLLVLLHTLFPIALVLEVVLLGARPGPAWPAWVALLLAAQLLREASIRALGPRWNVRIWVVPGSSPIRRGPYRWLKHPNYLAVALELFAAPMMFGAWRTALAFSALNALALAIRIPAEERALRWAAREP
jgi:methyltransferase